MDPHLPRVHCCAYSNHTIIHWTEITAWATKAEWKVIKDDILNVWVLWMEMLLVLIEWCWHRRIRMIHDRFSLRIVCVLQQFKRLQKPCSNSWDGKKTSIKNEYWIICTVQNQNCQSTCTHNCLKYSISNLSLCAFRRKLFWSYSQHTIPYSCLQSVSVWNIPFVSSSKITLSSSTSKRGLDAILYQ